MGKIDLIALDLDGTFLDPAGEISPASLDPVRTARAAGVKVVEEDDDILLISDDGTIIRMAAADVNLYSRTAQGVRVMRVSEGTKVISLARVPQENEGETQEET